jgi:presenilin-like A22 family membrane protease
MNFSLRLFLQEFILFGATMVLGLAAAYRHAANFSAEPILQAPAFGIEQVILLAILVSAFLLVLRSEKLGKYIIWILFIAFIWAGSQVISDLFITSSIGAFMGLLAVLLFFLWRTVLSHDFVIILALAGAGAVIGVSVSPTVGIIALVLLSFYDIIAVYRTKHMVRLAEGMIRAGAVSGFIIPSDFKSYLQDRREAMPRLGEHFMVLGSGDVVFPLIFASSLMRQSLAEAVTVAAFAVIGVFLTHVLFVGQKKRQAMAALPPIATMSLIGYVVALLFNL